MRDRLRERDKGASEQVRACERVREKERERERERVTELSQGGVDSWWLTPTPGLHFVGTHTELMVRETHGFHELMVTLGFYCVTACLCGCVCLAC